MSPNRYKVVNVQIFQKRVLLVKFKTFVSDSHHELDRDLNEHFNARKCSKIVFVQLSTSGEANYAVLVAWEDE